MPENIVGNRSHGRMGEKTSEGRYGFTRQGAEVRTNLSDGVKSAEPSAIGAAVEIGAQVGKQTFLGVQKNRLEGAVADAQRLAIAHNQNELDPTNPLYNEARVRALSDSETVFRSYRAAMEQGAMSDTAAKIAIESEMKRLVNQFPALGQDIRRMAGELTGIDPTGSIFKFRTAGPAKQDKTPLQKELEEGEFAATQMGMPRDSFANSILKSYQLKRLKEEQEAVKEVRAPAVGEIFNEAYTTAQIDSHQFGRKVLSMSLQNSRNGVVGITQEQQVLLKAEVTQQKQAAIADYADKMRGQAIDPELYSQRVKAISESYDSRIKFIEDSDLNTAASATLKGREALQTLQINAEYPVLVKLRELAGTDGDLGAVAQMLVNPESPFNRIMAQYDPKWGELSPGDGGYSDKLLTIVESVWGNEGGAVDPALVSKGQKVAVAEGHRNPSMANAKRPDGSTNGQHLLNQLLDRGEADFILKSVRKNPESALLDTATFDYLKSINGGVEQFASNIVTTLSNQSFMSKFLGGARDLSEYDIEVTPNGDLMILDKKTGENIAEEVGSTTSLVDVLVGVAQQMPLTSNTPAMMATGRNRVRTQSAIADTDQDARVLKEYLSVLDIPSVAYKLGTSKQQVINRINKQIKESISQPAAEEEPVQEQSEQDLSVATLGSLTPVDVPAKYVPLVQEAASEYNLDPNLVARLIKQESQFNPAAVSPTGASGMFQFTAGTARDMGLRVDDEVDERMDPQLSAKAGARYIRRQIDAFDGDVVLGVAAYNAGVGGVRHYLKTGEFKDVKYKSGKVAVSGKDKEKEVKGYVKKILGISLDDYLENLKRLNA